MRIDVRWSEVLLVAGLVVAGTVVFGAAMRGAAATPDAPSPEAHLAAFGIPTYRDSLALAREDLQVSRRRLAEQRIEEARLRTLVEAQRSAYPALRAAAGGVAPVPPIVADAYASASISLDAAGRFRRFLEEDVRRREQLLASRSRLLSSYEARAADAAAKMRERSATARRTRIVTVALIAVVVAGLLAWIAGRAAQQHLRARPAVVAVATFATLALLVAYDLFAVMP